MIVTLSGKVAEKIADIVVLDVHGVGYGVWVTPEDYGQLTPSQHAKLYIYEHIRETAYDLYGFISVETKQLFELLLGVNGVGPRMALNVLSIGSVNSVRAAIAGGDIKFIQAANGVGKRVAERVIIELKDKVGLVASADAASLLQSEAALRKDEAVEALMSLGYSAQDAAASLAGVPADIPTEDRVKQALKGSGL